MMRRANGSTAKPTTIAQYLRPLPANQRAALEKLRQQIHAAAPGVEECISYGMPGFRYDGGMLVWMGATAKHCAFYPGAVVADFADELEDYSTSKGTIRFTPDAPIPAPLIRKLVKATMLRQAKRRARKK